MVMTAQEKSSRVETDHQNGQPRQSKGQIYSGKDRPVALPVLAENIPEPLRKLRQWLVWRFDWEVDKWRKPPIHPATGHKANRGDEATLLTLDQALDLYHKGRHGVDGIGLFLKAINKLTVFDPDDCFDPLTGELRPEAKQVLALIRTYAEYSPTNTGIRAFVWGSWPGDKKYRLGGFNVEIYTEDQYVTVTGQRLDGSPAKIACGPTVQHHLNALADYLCHLSTGKPPFKPNHQTATGDQARKANQQPLPNLEHRELTTLDENLIQRGREMSTGAKFSRLWDGKVGSEEDHSALDMALCNQLAYLTGCDRERMIHLFRHCELYRPGKCENRDFADGRSYLERTVDRAIADYQPFQQRDHSTTTRATPASPPPADPPDDPPPERPDRPEREPDKPKSQGHWLTAVDLMAEDEVEDYIVEGVALAGESGVWGGPLKTFKTGTQADFAVSIASGTPFLNYFKVPKPRAVLFISVESGKRAIKSLIRRICAARKLDPRTLDAMFRCVPIRLGNPSELDEVRATIRRDGYKVVCFDPTYITHCPPLGIDKNDVYGMGSFIHRLNEACRDEGADTWYSHHTGKRVEIGKATTLADLTGSGWGEFAPQWVLLNHLEQFDEENGSARLIMRIGARAGHGGLFEVNIREGRRQPGGPDNRGWHVEVEPTSQDEVQTRKEPGGKGTRGDNLTPAQKDALVLLKLDEVAPNGEPAAKSTVRKATGLGTRAFNSCLERLFLEEVLEAAGEVLVEGGGPGHKTKQRAPAIRRRARPASQADLFG